VKGDTLWSIAKRTYGNPLQWRKIWNANSGMLIARDRRNATDNGHWIYPGQKLTIPA
jgi:nucleoid-associated protein YgaU